MFFKIREFHLFFKFSLIKLLSFTVKSLQIYLEFLEISLFLSFFFSHISCKNISLLQTLLVKTPRLSDTFSTQWRTKRKWLSQYTFHTMEWKKNKLLKWCGKKTGIELLWWSWGKRIKAFMSNLMEFQVI